MKRIYHHYELWEDYKCGFYNNCSGEEKEKKIQLVLEMFNDKNLTKQYMLRVINEWKYSCEQNLTNPSINKIAYIGQGSCCLYGNIPNTVTMEAWSLLDKEIKDRSDNIAQEIIEIWKDKNKHIQLCLNIF